MREARTLVWAVDPFREKQRSQNAALRALNVLADAETRIQPVYVTHPKDESARESLREHGDQILRRWTASRLLTPLLPMEVLTCASSSLTDQAATIAEHARKYDAFFILACHLPRFALRKWFAGSFCESLSVASEASVLIVTEKWKFPTKSKKPGKILFATDFSPHSVCAFEKVIEFAAERSWGVTLFHNIEYPLYPEMEFVYSAVDVLDQIESELIHSAHSQAAQLEEKARVQGVAVKVVIDESHRNHAGLAVMREVSKGYQIVAVAAHSGILQRTFVGSTSRYLIRESPTPVWVIRIPEEKIAAASIRTPKSEEFFSDATF